MLGKLEKNMKWMEVVNNTLRVEKMLDLFENEKVHAEYDYN
jgi:hypothetical protein